MSKPYTEEEVERGLLALAMENGKTNSAAKVLKRDALPIPARTLSDWKRRHATRYEQVRDTVLPQIRRASAMAHRDMERRELELSAKLVEKLTEEVPTMDARDAINALGKSDIGSGIHFDKAQIGEGEPTQIIAHESASEIIRALAAEGIHISDIQEAIDVESFDEPLTPFEVDDEHVLPSGESVA